MTAVSSSSLNEKPARSQTPPSSFCALCYEVWSTCPFRSCHHKARLYVCQYSQLPGQRFARRRSVRCEADSVPFRPLPENQRSISSVVFSDVSRPFRLSQILACSLAFTHNVSHVSSNSIKVVGAPQSSYSSRRAFLVGHS